MRFTGFLACLIVGIECAEKATGDQAQTLFKADMIWLWWVIALYWIAWSIRFALADS